MATHSYKDLRVWQTAMELTERVYGVTAQLPPSEKFALGDQLKRCAVSVPSNIAEGQKRLNRQETIQFCGIALGSSAELETQLILTNKIYKIPVAEELRSCEEVAKMLTGLIKALRSKNCRLLRRRSEYNMPVAAFTNRLGR